MREYQVSDVRDIALLGHGACGKTTLADALLFEAHAVDRLGSVDEETSISDFDDEEHRRHFSIDTSVLHADHEGKHIHILDAPGYPDFVGAALEAINAVETAVIVVSATAGVETNTRKMFEEAGKHDLARVLVINKCDAENVKFSELMESIRAVFGQRCVLFNVPNDVGPGFSGVIDILNPAKSIPDTCPVDIEAMRSEVIDAIVDADEDAMERYLEEGDISVEDLEKLIPLALEEGTLVPIFCTCAKQDIGVKELLHALCVYGLSPTHLKHRLNGSGTEIEPSEDAPFVGQVFKTVNDKFVGHMSFIRVLAGTMTKTQPLVNLRSGKSMKLSHLYEVQGKKYEEVNEAIPGDIIAVAKIDGLHIGDPVAHDPKLGQTLPEFIFPHPMFGLAVEPKKRGDETKISSSLQKMAEEDPTFRISHDEQTHELVIAGLSQLHLEVIQNRLKQRFDLEITTKEPKIPYRETISSESQETYRHKKQSGGRGQFAEVHIRIYPLSREITTREQLEEQFANKSRFEKMRACHYHPEFNFAFIDHIVGGSVPNQYVPAVEKGCLEVMGRGAVAGYRMQDIAVELYDGKDHAVDSSEAAFKFAARKAFRAAIMDASPMLLEPLVKLEVTAPMQYMGTILGDLNTRRAHVMDQQVLPGEVALFIAEAPLGEMMRYAAQLGSITQGQGSYSMEMSHYEMMPPNVQQAIVAGAKLEDEEE